MASKDLHISFAVWGVHHHARGRCIQLGLPIDGNAVTGVSLISRPARLCYDLLGRSPSEGKFATLRFSWLKANFEHLSSTGTELEVMQAARAYRRWSMNPGIGRSYMVPIYCLMIENHSGEGFIWMPYSVPEVTAVIPSYAQEGEAWNYWGDEHEQYITMWNNWFSRVPQMDRCLDLRPSPQYLQWYYEKGKPFLFGGRSMVVPPYTTRIGQHLPHLHHAPESEPESEPEPEPKLHSGNSSYHLNLGGDNYFPGSSSHRYHSEFHIFSPPSYSAPSCSYPPQYSAPSSSYPPPYSTPSSSYQPPYSTPSSSYPPPYSAPSGSYPSIFSTPPGLYPPPYSTPPESYLPSFSTPPNLSSSIAFDMDEENVDCRNRPQR
ncbi:uncharacterized protein [Gossypium hirsutum]|uniref:Aminotransferase-like plant mobile domain-containing protein n=1 Tax=Gossypium hirsutum TaxID=3635 RepID=A0A1U8PYF8_GOSHI|nr:uncharacterized protein LOC107963257 [Gossypium hirsutum]